MSSREDGSCAERKILAEKTEVPAEFKISCTCWLWANVPQALGVVKVLALSQHQLSLPSPPTFGDHGPVPAGLASLPEVPRPRVCPVSREGGSWSLT